MPKDLLLSLDRMKKRGLSRRRPRSEQRARGRDGRAPASRRPHLPNAPITEAVLDIQATLPAGTPLQQLAPMYEAIRDRYPKRRTRRRWEGTMVEFKDGKPVSVPPLTGQEDGYLFISDDDRQVVQARLDGFTFSRLKPYETWERLRDEAKELWGRYVEIARPTTITRLALRYVNRIELPLPIDDFKRYLRTRFELAPGIPQGIQGFFLRVEIPHPRGPLILLTETVLPTEPRASRQILPFILDIDVFVENRTGFPMSEVWPTFEVIRELKNDIFFSSITPKAEALFQ